MYPLPLHTRPQDNETPSLEKDKNEIILCDDMLDCADFPLESEELCYQYRLPPTLSPLCCDQNTCSFDGQLQMM